MRTHIVSVHEKQSIQNQPNVTEVTEMTTLELEQPKFQDVMKTMVEQQQSIVETLLVIAKKI